MPPSRTMPTCVRAGCHPRFCVLARHVAQASSLHWSKRQARCLRYGSWVKITRHSLANAPKHETVGSFPPVTRWIGSPPVPISGFGNSEPWNPATVWRTKQRNRSPRTKITQAKFIVRTFILCLAFCSAVRVLADPATAGSTTPAATPASGIVAPSPDTSWRVFAGHFSPHRPIYFILGPDRPAAKFQFSFKYRLWGESSGPVIPAEPVHGVYFGYSQRSLWDITAASSPFYDTSYMPEFFYEFRPTPTATTGWQWRGFAGGVQHESNGQAGPQSRSLNIVYVKPTITFATRNGWRFTLAPRFFYYIGGLSDNPDLTRYRGYGEYRVTVLKDGLSLGLMARVGSHADRGSLQADFTVPLKVRSGGFATFVLLQYFDGYGESLLGYRSKSHALRVGVSLVR